MKIDEIKNFIQRGTWNSITTEIRPSIVKDDKGNLKPIYCTRRFTYPTPEEFNLEFTGYADPFGKAKLSKMDIRGHLIWGNPHPLIEGAWEVDYDADISFAITLEHIAIVAALNQTPTAPGIEKWELGVSQQVMGLSMPAFGLKAGENFKEYDLVYGFDNFLFNGARNIDGRPFDSPQNRPTNLQVPLVRTI